jgi:hypothetical protein
MQNTQDTKPNAASKRHVFVIDGDVIVKGDPRQKYRRVNDWEDFDFDGDEYHRRWLESISSSTPSKPDNTSGEITQTLPRERFAANVNIGVDGHDPQLNETVYAYSAVTGVFIRGTVISIGKNEAGTKQYTVRPFGHIYNDIKVFRGDIKRDKKD